MKSLLIKTVSVVAFLLIFIKSWAAEVEPGTRDVAWFKEPWVLMVTVGLLVGLIIAFIKTGDKKTRHTNNQRL